MSSIRIPCPKTNTTFGEIIYPGLNVEVLLPNLGFQPFEFILDSGADCTMVPRSMAALVGFSLTSTPDIYVTGIARRPMPAYIGRLNMRIQQETFEVRYLFMQSDRTPFLLGRVDFFSIFDVSFDGNSCSIVLTRR